mgnify:CR=1 FL=1
MILNFLFDILFPKYCLSCNQEGEYFCLECKKKPFKQWDGRLAVSGEKYFDALYCLGDYEDEVLGTLIKTCKYRFVKELTIDLAKLLIKEISDKEYKGVIVPVPLSKRRERWRGFNQSEEIGRIVARELNLEYRDCLIRIKHKKAQAKLSEKERQENMNGCFEARGEIPERVILIDDVITTGTTVNECSRVLKEKGTKYIIVLTMAKG